MPTWTITDQTGRVETIEADRIEDDGNSCSWRTVVAVTHEPRWSCVRRVGASDVTGEPPRGSSPYVR